ncbi:MAG: 4'-phosphopantetheinyl transferase superfamily protein [bacterium]|nr:4'-phosphopantetheinyl transferase superfamily protein [bacterium]
MIEIYSVKVPPTMDDTLFSRLLDFVAPEKQDRIRRFVRESDRLRGLFSDLLIRAIIMEKLHLRNEQISFGTNEYGKPFLIDRKDFHFNISHSGIWVVAAMDTQPVGVDVEKVSDFDMDITGSFLSEDEHHDLMGQGEGDQLSYFFTLWSLKESYIKIIGKGLSQPLDSFSIRVVDDKKIVIHSEGKQLDDVSFALYDIHNEYKTVLCASHDRLPKDVTMQCPDLLIETFLK